MSQDWPKQWRFTRQVLGEAGQPRSTARAGNRYRCLMRWAGGHRTWRWTAFATLVLLTAGCSSSPSTTAHSATAHATPGPATESFARNRFTVTFSAQALEQASADGVNLPQVVADALGRINALLPGPPTPITVTYGGSHLIPQTGTNGETNPASGVIAIVFGPTPQVSVSTIMKLWLPRTFSHEIDHSVRILAGPGAGVSLLEEIISEGISSAADSAAFPGPPDPWDRAISRSQECALWKKAQPLLGQPGQPLLGQSGLYDDWMFGAPGIPHWTAFTIGYDIVTDYHLRHPSVSWSAITSTSAAAILAGSRYQPCSS